MVTVQQWGRKESVIWPPRGYIYTLGTFILACILTAIFIYIRFQYALSPLQRYYFPYYLRTEAAGLTHPVSQYQLLYVSDGEEPGRAALDSDVQPGSTPQFEGNAVTSHSAQGLTAERVLVNADTGVYEFFARHDAEDLRIWRMAAQDLVILFDIVEQSELVADLICELHEGTSVTLPGNYSAAQLVLLGYRIPVRKPPRPANLPGNRYAKQSE